jgi:CspA family cold shock protein
VGDCRQTKRQSLLALCARLAQPSPSAVFAARAFRAGAIHQRTILMPNGTVKFFNSSKGFGFISPEGGAKDVFVHATAIEAAGMHTLNEGDKVSFDIQPDAKGSKAVNLAKI